ncbi:response regulator transcription factor [Micromonospora sp. NPDC000089]|uniref:response regulator transcription factor n=1 Tax=unclassified Micromonospora TaxID=2617518 RepID=UPI0036B36F76
MVEPVTSRYRVLVADDDQAVRDSLERALRFEGYAVELARDGVDALARVTSDAPDLVVLDVMMPRMNGLEASRRLRAAGNRTPMLMLTARDAVGDRVAGLDAGADDYLAKPFALQELLARVRALLRRTAGSQGQPEEATLGALRLDRRSRQVFWGGTPVELTRTEFSLLQSLIDHAGQVLTRQQLFELVWGYDLDRSSNSLDVYIGYLRRKLEAAGAPRLVHTVWGVGFVLREPR